MAWVRPPRNGPTLRHRSAPSKLEAANSGKSAAKITRVTSPLAANRLVPMQKRNPLPPCSHVQEHWRRLRNTDLQFARPADLRSAGEVDTGQHVRWDHRGTPYLP